MAGTVLIAISESIFIYFYKNEFRFKSICRIMQKAAVRDKNESSVFSDFLGIMNISLLKLKSTPINK